MAVLASSSTCSLEPLLQSIEFKSGAVYTGSIVGGKMSGRGTFRWPSGLRYTGEYVNNKRQGHGEQEWPEGSRYEGEFWEDLRQGWGRHSWSSGETYEGEYVGDKKHGKGSYTWPSGAKFSGHFEGDQKEGHGVFLSPEGETFEGMYHGDVRDGEGVMTYLGGKQDVGTWRGEKLAQLKFVVPAVSFDPYSSHPLGSTHSLDTPDLKSRGKYGPKGPLEVGSEELLEAAAVGDATRVAAILKGEGVYVDVKDKNSHSALFAAALHCHPSILHLLLDYGADVNQLDVGRVSPLTACHHLLYGSLPKAQELLKRLPASCYSTQTNSSSPASEYTMHTSDFLSTPPNTPYAAHPTTGAHVGGGPTPKTPQQLPPSLSLPLDLHRGDSTIECNGLCKAKSALLLQSQARKLPAQASDDLHVHVGRQYSPDAWLSQVQSYPLLDGRSRKKVRFASMETLLPRQRQEKRGSYVATPVIDGEDQERSGIRGKFNPPGSKPEYSRKVNVSVSRADHGNPEEKEKSLLPVYQYSVNDGVPPGNAHVSPLSNDRALVLRPSLLSREGSNPDNETPTNSRGVVSVVSSDVHHKNGLKNGAVDSGGVDQQSRGQSRESRGLPSESDDSSSERGDCSSSQSDTEEESGSPCNYVNGIWPPASEETQHRDVSSGLSSPSGLPQASLDSTPSVAFSNGRSPHLSNTHTLKTNSSYLAVPTPRSYHFPLKKTARLPYMGALVNSELHSSSVFSSTRYGPIVSAAQSTTLSCGASDQLEELSESSSSPLSGGGDRDEGEISLSHTLDSSISLLLQRGAEPDVSSFPLPPLFYAVAGGDFRAVRWLLERGASTSQQLPPELGSLAPLHAAVTLPGPHSPAIVEALLQYGANPNYCGVGLGDGTREREENEEGSLTTISDSDTVEVTEHGSESDDGGTGKSGAVDGGSRGEVRLAGDNPGFPDFTPLHLACALAVGEAVEVPPEVVSAVVEVLLAHGAEVNRVAKGYSPLSLAILSGYDCVVDQLLMKGADPNLPLGRGVATALCSLTMHTAHKRRDSKTTLMMVRKLLEHGADILQPVKVRDEWGPGTVADFAHEAFKQDKRLCCMRYSALNKSERVRYKATRRVIQHFINLLRCKALESITKEPLSQHMSKRLYRTTSASEPRPLKFIPPGHTRNQKAALRRDAQSAGAMPRRKCNALSFSLPERTLRAALEDVNKIHGDPNSRSSTVDFSYSARGPSSMIRDVAPTSRILWVHPESEPLDLEKVGEGPPPGNSAPSVQQWSLSSFCYECGRRAGVRLSKCQGCGSVYYCSHTCREEGFRRGHKEECTGAQVQVKTGPLSNKRLGATDSRKKQVAKAIESVKIISLKTQNKVKTHRKLDIKTKYSAYMS